MIMKTRKSITKIHKGFTENKALDKYADKVLFQDKVEMANQVLKIAGKLKV